MVFVIEGNFWEKGVVVGLEVFVYLGDLGGRLILFIIYLVKRLFYF